VFCSYVFEEGNRGGVGQTRVRYDDGGHADHAVVVVEEGKDLRLCDVGCEGCTARGFVRGIKN